MHAVLLGDSIFDNAAYVPGEPAVVEQLRRALGAGWRATLLAIDGDTTVGVAAQMTRLPADATHLVVSVGGNDALLQIGLLAQTATTVDEALALMEEARTRFRSTYRDMVRAVQAAGLPVAVCTIYDTIPVLTPSALAALAGFNEVILREAFAARLPVIDLRLVTTDPDDYAPLSPIEPSAAGGAKIVRALAAFLTSDPPHRRSVIYA